jgi:hypothetical protein
MAMGRAAAKPREDVVRDLVKSTPGRLGGWTGLQQFGAMECAQNSGLLGGKAVLAAVQTAQQAVRGSRAQQAGCRVARPQLQHLFTLCVAHVRALPPSPAQVKMAVSRKLCGAVIGQKGQTIRDFMLDSGATIRVQVGCVHRVVGKRQENSSLGGQHFSTG